MLAVREQLRDSYLRDRDPIGEDRMLWRPRLSATSCISCLDRKFFDSAAAMVFSPASLSRFHGMRIQSPS